jgi:hypothetical protein
MGSGQAIRLYHSVYLTSQYCLTLLQNCKTKGRPLFCEILDELPRVE